MTIGGFLFAESLIGPERLTARRVVDRLQNIHGTHSGFRRNHAKGVAVEGYFESNGSGAQLCAASIFRTGRYSVRGRFSLSGGNPHIAEDPGIVRGLGLQVGLPAGEQWRMAMINLPVFLDPTPQDFHDRGLAFANDPATGKPNPRLVSDYLATHPRTAAAMKIAKSVAPAPTFATTTFHGLNAFEFTDPDGTTIPVRWKLVPETESIPGDDPRPASLFTQLTNDIRQSPCRWTMMVTQGVRGQDRTDDASVPWPSTRPTVNVGTLVLTGIATETSDNVRTVNFDPLVLPNGIAPSDDPLLSARSAVYAESFRRRAGEPDNRGSVETEGRA
ncbi:catalase family peroxidase [Nocardia sp. NPDC058519]|uniref:catalase family peroxidase n=1 Tax=Nocardia sp. NPDC058519 TaxID=3346535 RepID=UPI00365D8FBA